MIERGALQQVGIYDRRAVQVLLLRQHGADLPGRRADRRRVPLPVPPVRPGVLAGHLRALRVRLRDAHRPPPRQGPAPAGRRRPARSTRSGTATRAAGPSSTPPRSTASPPRWSATTTASCGRRPGPRRCDIAAEGLAARATAPASACWPAAGYPRGRLRLCEVRPRRAGHQRRRLPRPADVRRGGRLPRRPRRRHAASAYLRRHRARAEPCCSSGFEPEEESPILFLRLRKAVLKSGLRSCTLWRRSRPAGSRSSRAG